MIITMKHLSAFVIALFLISNVLAGVRVENYVFAERDTSVLSMDIYLPDDLKEKNTTIIFIFGGGFFAGSKKDPRNVTYCDTLAAQGFIVAAIDYRLGLKGKKMNAFNFLKSVHHAIDVAVEDLYSATNFLVAHASEFKIDTSMIIVNGSSAGAITALQADYELANRSDISTALPANFRYAGIISFSGAMLSYEGKPDYKNPPAPTLFFHGTKDRLVEYNKIQVFWMGLFGSNALAKRFDKFNYPYYIYRYRDLGHEVAALPMERNIPDILFFINEFVSKKHPLKIDLNIKDGDLKPHVDPKRGFN